MGMPDNYYTPHFHTTMNLDPACTVFHSLFLHEYKSNFTPASIREETDFLTCAKVGEGRGSNQSFFGCGCSTGGKSGASVSTPYFFLGGGGALMFLHHHLYSKDFPKRKKK